MTGLLVRALGARLSGGLLTSLLSGLLAVAAAGLLLAPGCGQQSPPQPQAPAGTKTPPKQTTKPSADTLTLVFPYSSEKKTWIEEVTARFNQERHKSSSGKVIAVDAHAMGSGECVDETLEGRLEAHLISPASAAFIKLGNARSQAKMGSPLVGQTQDLVLSPVVIAMWKPMAEALGWGKKPIGWSDILELTASPNGWTSRGFPQWGQFRFGHTHPEYSNSGLMAAIAQAYWGAGKVAGLTLEDLANPAVGKAMAGIQGSIVHYGESTGFFGRKLFSSGPEYLSAAVLYENMVIESYDRTKYQPAFPIVAIYPKEGTFWSEHPVAIVERPWVTQDHRDAAKAYIAYLLDRPQQEAAMKSGFRPSDVSVPLTAPIDTAHGIDPKEPTTVLETPGADVISGVLDLWKVNKKKAHVVLVMDCSGSMRQEQKMTNAREGAATLIDLLGAEDTFSILPFSSQPRWALQSVQLKDQREHARQITSGLIADGGTALYDSVSVAFDYLQSLKQRDMITAIVVLTDGADTDSALKLEALLNKVRSDEETTSVRIFTIGYGSKAVKEVLEKISDQTQAKYYTGTPENIRQVFKEIATFF